MAQATCSLPGCDKPRTPYRSGLCSGHQHRLIRYGDPLAPLHFRRISGPIEERLWAKINTSDPGGCWPWTGSIDGRGYGQINLGKDEHGRPRMARTHRLAFQFFYGPVPDGLGVLHRCDNPPCCKPMDLFAGTQGDNSLDMMAKGRGGGQFAPTGPPVSVEVLRELHHRLGSWARTGAAVGMTRQSAWYWGHNA